MNNLPVIPPFQRTQVMQIFVAAAVCIALGGLFWMVFTIMPAAIIDVQGTESYAADAQVTISFIQASSIAIPILIGFACLAWGIVRAIEERETGIATM